MARLSNIKDKKVADKFLSNNKTTLELHDKSTFKKWMKKKSVFPFDNNQLKINNDIIHFAYTMYEYFVGVHNKTKDYGDSLIVFNFGLQIDHNYVEIYVNESNIRNFKTIVDGDSKALTKIASLWVPGSLNLYDRQGRLEILQFKDVSERDFNSLFLFYGGLYYTMQLFSAVDSGEIPKDKILSNPYKYLTEINSWGLMTVEPSVFSTKNYYVKSLKL